MGRAPRIAAIGMTGWDTLLMVASYPPAGGYRVVEDERSLPAGTTANTAVALSRLGADVTMVARYGDDHYGEEIIAALRREPGIDTAAVTRKPGVPSDRCTVVVSRDPFDRTIFWHRGAVLSLGDPIDLTAMFAHDLVLVDTDDIHLYSWLTDLPAHTSPRTRLLGTTTFLVAGNRLVVPNALDIVLRLDTVVTHERDLLTLTGAPSLDEATTVVRDRMVGSNLRCCVVTRGAQGCRACTREAVLDVPAYPVEVLDPTGAGDAFVAGVAWGMAKRWPWERTAALANALGAAATLGVGAQASLPTREDLVALTGSGIDGIFGRDA